MIVTTHLKKHYKKLDLNVISGFSTQISKEFWLPFTNNRSFETSPKIIDKAEGVYYYLKNNQRILDATSGLWLDTDFKYIKHFFQS
jgi:hypothetical protein